ncbi:innexin inx2-like [Agrilus planipennis]|uniref:Innexin n=1 Tax=Agrilus planipennis TaxID=224129 RepID=A0A1W4XPB6_AGRPL|nr:innexin inx2-like [Agrilus planipennis]
MLDFLKFCKSLAKNNVVHIDNFVFKLHYRLTVIVLVVSSVLITTKQFFGDPIDCEMDGTFNNMFDTYCWIYNTHIIKNTLENEILPGLGNYHDHIKTETPEAADSDEGIIKQKYYQWICIVLALQALLFYTPRYIWKNWEGGRLKMLAKDLGGPLLTSNWDQEAKDRLINYIVHGKDCHNVYAIRFLFCELFNLINVVSQIVLTNWFLSGQFSGLHVFTDLMNGEDPLKMVFPKLVKCTYNSYGSSGSIQKRDALCILPLNVFNEKLYLIMWFWFYFLSLLSAVALLYRLLFFCVPFIRVYLLMARTKYVTKGIARIIVYQISFGNCFILYQLGNNLNPIVFRELIMGICNYLQSNKKHQSLSAEITFPI